MWLYFLVIVTSFHQLFLFLNKMFPKFQFKNKKNPMGKSKVNLRSQTSRLSMMGLVKFLAWNLHA